MKRFVYLVGVALLSVACQANELTVPAPQNAVLTQPQPAVVNAPPFKSQTLPMVKVKPEVQVVVKGEDIKLEVKLPALSAFKTQMLDLATASKIRATITDSAGVVYTPNGAVAGLVDYPVTGVINLTFNNVVPDQLLIVELQVTDGSADIPQADLALALKHTGVGDLTTSMNFQTTPTAKTMKALLALDIARARNLNLAALTTKMVEITGQAGTAPNFTYTTHPTLVNTSWIAGDLNAAVAPASLFASVYRMAGATVALTVSGLIGSDKINVQVTDAASAIKTNLGNGSGGAAFAIANATPGSGLQIKVGADPANTAQYTFTVNPSTPLTLTNNGTTNVSITAVPTAVVTSSLNPTFGALGSTLTINGSGFSTTAGDNIVRFAGAGGNIDVVAATVNGAGTQLTVAVPATALYGSQNVTVRLSGGPESSPALTYEVRPEFTFATASGAIGSTVTLNGSGFHTTAGSNDVRFSGGNTQALVQSVNSSGTQMTIEVPEGVSGAQTVTVKVGNQTSISRTFNIIPTLASVTSAQVVGGTITLTGTGFSTTAANNTVRFTSGSTVTAAAATANAEGTQLTVAVPAGLFGVQGLSVQVASFNSLGGQPLAITPNITNLSITSGSSGDTLTITGTGFHTTAGSNTVRFGANSVSATLNTGNLVVTVPAHAAGAANVTVQVGTQTSTASNFTILPTITGITGAPTSGGKPALIRGETITITGTNFDTTVANNKVLFGSLEVTPATVPNNTSMTVVVPAAAETETFGDVSVRVKTNNQTSTTSVTATVVGVTLSVTNGGLY
jgi:hypothetical protein